MDDSDLKIEDIARLRGGYEAVGRGDLEAALELLDPDVVWTEPNAPDYPFAGEHLGHAGILALRAVAKRDWAQFYYAPEELFRADNDRLIVLGTLTAQARGQEAAVSAPFAHVWESSAGKLTRGRNFLDTSAFVSESRRRQLSDIADQLMEQATAISSEWEQLGNALETTDASAPPTILELPSEPTAATNDAAVDLARRLAWDIAASGTGREEAREELREILGSNFDDRVLEGIEFAPEPAANPSSRRKWSERLRFRP